MEEENEDAFVGFDLGNDIFQVNFPDGSWEDESGDYFAVPVDVDGPVDDGHVAGIAVQRHRIGQAVTAGRQAVQRHKVYC